MTDKKPLLGIDYGRARIGLAVSEAGLIARPLRTIQNRGDRKNLAALSEITAENPLLIILGLPQLADGKEAGISTEIKHFGELLQSELGLDVIYQNEYLTSVEAENHLRGTKIKSKDSVDALAAAMILQSYIDKGEK